jgi:hypothetical protein
MIFFLYGGDVYGMVQIFVKSIDSLPPISNTSSTCELEC